MTMNADKALKGALTKIDVLKDISFFPYECVL